MNAEEILVAIERNLDKVGTAMAHTDAKDILEAIDKHLNGVFDACSRGNIKLVKKLLNTRARISVVKHHPMQDIDILKTVNSRGDTPLHAACRGGHTDVRVMQHATRCSHAASLR